MSTINKYCKQLLFLKERKHTFQPKPGDITQESLAITTLEHRSTVTNLSSEELAGVDIETT